MIQRIQSIWLLIATVCGILFLFLPLAEFANVAQTEYAKLYAENLIVFPKELVTKSSFYTYPLFIGGLIIAILSLITIFLYKKRKLQMRLTSINVLISIVVLALTFFLYTDSFAKDFAMNINYQAGIFMPIIALVCLIMAYRGINRDEKLIRAADRIR
ncbi:MAG: DUF4293 domain-containing protein [Hyphomicrobiales bacterium]